MTLNNKLCRLLPLLWCFSLPALSAEISEHDYFSDLPEVLTVTRLAQPLRDTPGAVTIIDRDKIRRSGARDVTDLLRLVPGYVVGGLNGAHPSAAYHAPLDDYGMRNLVLIDGRSAYNAFYLGDTHRGLQGVPLEDVERIEVLRGSNSAAFGANAMFGVINIVTRHSADTHGAAVTYANGDAGIKDHLARVGWGNDAASFRLSTSRKRDTGYGGSEDNRVVENWHFRSDLRPSIDQEIMFAAGTLDMSQGFGQGPATTEPGDPFRTTYWRESFLNLQLRKQLSGTDEIKLSANYDEATFRDATPYILDSSVTLDFGGKSRKAQLEFQHQLGLGPRLRAVWGAGYEKNEAESPALFYRHDRISVHESRLFGNIEWRPHEQWVINAGGLVGDHSQAGSYFSPRLMANFHLAPDHTFRLGTSKSERTPNIFELSADLRYYPKDFASLIAGGKAGPALAAFLNIPYRLVYASGTVKPERLKTYEVGYFGNLQDLRMTVDVRGYVESMRDVIDDDRTFIPGYVITGVNFLGVPVGTPIPVNGYVNKAGFTVRGMEYQLRWKPLDGTEIWLNQNFQDMVWENEAEAPDVNKPPTHATTIALFQKLPGGLDFSLMLHSMGAMTWGNEKDGLPFRRRLDARLAWPFNIGSTRAELAITTQAANGNYEEYLLRRGYEFERRTFGTLRFEF